MGTVNLYSEDIPRVSSVLLISLVKIAQRLCSIAARVNAGKNLRGKETSPFSPGAFVGPQLQSAIMSNSEQTCEQY
jgi:hypothetical protein